MELDRGRAIFDHPDWPKFRWDAEALAKDLALLAEEEKLLTNKLKLIDPFFLEELFRVALYEELVCSFQLDDEFISLKGAKVALAAKSLAFADGLAQIALGDLLFVDPERACLDNYANLLLDARANPDRRLSAKRLNRWRLALTHPGSVAGLGSLRAAAYGSRPARPSGRPCAPRPLPAPPAASLQKEMGRFLSWHNAPWPYDPALKAALAHLWVLAAQPYVAVSGRFARLVADLALCARGPIAGHYSLSKVFLKDREAYWEALAQALGQADLDLTAWLAWQIKAVRQAAQAANDRFDLIINKAVHWGQAHKFPLSERQKNVLALLEADFVGPLTPERYSRVAQCDIEVAERELNELVSRNLIQPKRLAWRALEPQPSRPGLVF
jgi:hypothetical protein